jgi:hypothetical protein
MGKAMGKRVNKQLRTNLLVYILREERRWVLRGKIKPGRQGGL